MSETSKSICDESIYAQIFKEQYKTVFNYIYYRYGSKTLAEDILQESFIRLWQNCKDVPYEKAKAFLYTAANNLAISTMRHDKVKLAYKSELSSNISANMTNESPEFILIHKEYNHRLKNAIEALPEKQRAAYILSRIEKKTYKEISELMEVSVKAIEKLMHKALIKLKNEIGNI